MKRSISIVGLARHLGLSVSTVSKALNARSGVSEATRKRVQDAAAALGFSPDPTARRLRRQARVLCLSVAQSAVIVIRAMRPLCIAKAKRLGPVKPLPPT